jgi:hypothetical protein
MINGEDIFEKYKRGNFDGDYLFISPDEWQEIKDTYPVDVVKERLAEVCMTWPIPYADISEEDAYDDYMKLKGIRWNEYLKEGEWFPRKAAETRYPLTYEGKQLYFSRLNTGNDASNHFQQQNRWSVDGSVSPGPKRTWETKSFMTSLIGAAYSLKLEQIGKKELRTMIGLRKYICSQFKPNVAKMFYEYLKAETVLDFSMGWGDRLAGAFASDSVKHYVGLDPRKENHSIYEKQRDFYTKHTSFFENSTKTNFYCSPAEDFDYSEWNEYFDVVFTSPPYFSVERYSHDDTQSWVRYKNIDVWNEHFLHTTLGKIIPTVKKGGIMAINIADVYAGTSDGKGWLEITNPMGDFLTSQGLTYKGCIGMEMAKRPNSGGAGTAKNDHYEDETLELAEETKDQRFCEPIWIFQNNKL